MLNISDNDLDRLSREAAEKYEPDEGSSPSWENFERHLDAELSDPAQPVGNPNNSARRIGRVLLLLLVLGLSYFLFRVDSKLAPAVFKTNKQSSSVKSTAIQPLPGSSVDKIKSLSAETAQGSLQATGENDPKKESTHYKILKGSKNQNNLTTSSTVTAGKEGNHPSNGPKTIQSAPIEAYSTSNTGHPSSTKNTQEGRNGKSSPFSAAKGDGLVGAGLIGQDLSEISNNSSNAIPAPVSSTGEFLGLKSTALPGLQSQSSYSSATKDPTLKLAGVNQNPMVVPTLAKSGQANSRSMRLNRSLKIGLLLAPDYSDVNSARNNKMSSNMGITIGYYLLNKWSINTGLIYTKKNYGVNGQDFKAPANSFYIPIGSDIEYVNGSCYMLEIPISVRRDFNISKKTLFFVNGGLSSYLMKKEKYVIDYVPAPGSWGPPVSGQAEGPKSFTPTNYWFSVASFSLGIEQEISKSLSFQVEPFAKLPLRGIGTGNIEISSYGIAFSLRYAPLLSRSRK
jgi:hypothetical protein